MMTTTLQIAPDVMEVLRAAHVTDTSVVLPAGQLPRDLYVNVNKVLELAGGKWNRGAKAHLFASDPREKLGLAMESGGIATIRKEIAI